MSSILKNFNKYRYLLGELAKKNIKLRYRRSYLGILWTLIEPLLTMIVLSIVFGTLLGRHNTDKAFVGVPFPVYVLTGRLLYSFFSSATNSAMKSIRANGAMIKKVYVPKYMYPISGIISNFIIFLISLIVLVAVMGFFLIQGSYKANINPYMLMSVFPLLNLMLFATGIGLILATLCVFFRDIEYLWSVMLMLIMYCSAIFYFASGMKGATLRLVKFNPLFGIIDNFRRSLFGQHMDFNLAVYTWGVSAIAVVIGIIVFYKKQDSFILNI
ncbi:ABC transporter permease [Eubacterium xylanophilum]|uniref:ABC transporter permease n=1 Tax=Eubacterium xylanophilum TaxID=39497 RepID=UPI000478A788|nr:ABC transporter permease [Eubacterium xylanophilum]